MKKKYTVLIALISIFAYFYMNSGSQKDQSDFTENPLRSYDYIVVGSGSAGAVVASRLSENPNVTVLLVEAGGDDRGDDRVLLPPLFAPLLNNAWSQYMSTRLQSARPVKDVAGLRSGMILGGTSSINYQIYARGSRHDFDQWSKLTKDKSWKYKNILSYFKRSEGVLDKDLKDSPYHGNSGPLSISTFKSGWDIYNKLIEGFQEIGFSRNSDYNGKSMEGVSHTQYTIANGKRVSCAHAFIHPALRRPNLHVMVKTYAQRVLIHKDQAYAVDIIYNMRKNRIHARREIILSAGTTQTPKILMQSGIGPKDVLTKYNISVVKDLPVGENYQIHPITEIPISITEPVTGTIAPMLLLPYLQYLIFKTGLLATPDMDVLLFTSTTQEAQEKDWPDLQVSFFGKPMVSSVLKMYMSDDDIINEVADARAKHEFGIGCLPAVLRPKSRGNLSIVSNDPFDLPVIRTNLVEVKEDLDTLIRGIRICQSLVQTTALKSVGASLTDTIPLSVCKNHEFDSEEYWRCYIQNKHMIHYHPVGTCKMGSKADPTAVLDSKLRVKGIKGLRVADASVMPTIVSANTHAATVMIGERAADMIESQRK